MMNNDKEVRTPKRAETLKPENQSSYQNAQFHSSGPARNSRNNPH